MSLDQEKRPILTNFILGITLYAVFHVLDLVVYPQFAAKLLVIRVLVILWLSLCVFLLFNIPNKKLTVLAGLYLIPSAFGTSLMCYVVGEGFASVYFIGNFLVIIGAASFARVKSSSFAVLMVAVFLQHLLLQCWRPVNIKDMVVTLFFLGAAVLLSIFIHASIRRYEEMLLKTQDELYVAATTDPLTNLFNRRKIIDLIEIEEIRIVRSKRTYVLAIGDIDNFKQINDTHGHDGGDAVLVSVAKRMKGALRAQDFVGRWGGEEFLIVLPETKLHEGKRAIERMREKICVSPIKIPGGSVKITMTWGVAASDQVNDKDSLIKFADDALYKGKRGKKNCVVVAQVKGK